MRASLHLLLVSLTFLSTFDFMASQRVHAQPAAGLPEGKYDPAIPSPEQYFGFPLGEWHIRHDALVQYFDRVGRESERVVIRDYAKSFEKRRLLMGVVTSPKLMPIARRVIGGERLEDVIADGRTDPLVVWLGYGVHGNEASATNCAPAVLYYLAASRDSEVEAFLDETIVLVDPCYNPDGYGRFSEWVNANRSLVPNPDPDDREHREPWPSGRTNHYGFDLNRDWLLAVHPETHGRLELFHRFRPHVLTDVHGMGTNSTYFFQPGVPSRQGTWTLDENLDLTRKLATYHARALDARGALYWSEERFDDFYYGKGSTYPDIFGSIGILFEQASARGHVQDSVNGELPFRKAIEQQVTTSLSTLEGATTEREALLEFRRLFDRRSKEAAAEDRARGYVFGSARDLTRTMALVTLLDRHSIEVRVVDEDCEIDGQRFEANRTFFVPTNQKNYYAVKTLFEEVTTFEDDVFYDVSSWTMPLAYGLPFATVDSSGASSLSLVPTGVRGNVERGSVATDARWIVLEPHDAAVPRVAFELVRNGLDVRVATRPMTITLTDGSPRDVSAGAVIVSVFEDGNIAETSAAAIEQVGDALEATPWIEPLSVRTGLTPAGIDFGSPNVTPLEVVKPLIVVGAGMSGYEAAELWHACDQAFGLTATRVDAERLGSVDLDDYTHILMPSGSPGGGSSRVVSKLDQWVRAGGVLLAQKSSASWVAEKILKRDREVEPDTTNENPEDPVTESDEPGEDADEKEPPVRYVDAERERAKNRIGGAIFEGLVDTTHPLGFGLDGSRIALFKNSTTIVPLDADPYVNVVRYTMSPRLSGYASDENIEAIAGTAAVIANRLGRGTIVRFADNPNFRGTWRGTRKIFGNALLYGRAIDNTRVYEEHEE